MVNLDHSHLSRAASSRLAHFLSGTDGVTRGRRLSQGQDGLQATNRNWSGNLSLAQMHGGSSIRDHQRSVGLPPILLAWTYRRGGGMVPGLSGYQPETHAHSLPGAGIAVTRLLPAI